MQSNRVESAVHNRVASGSNKRRHIFEHFRSTLNHNIGADVTELVRKCSAANNGAVLMVVDGQWAIGSIPSQLPTVDKDTDAGKVLTVNSDGEWAAAALPE